MDVQVFKERQAIPRSLNEREAKLWCLRALLRTTWENGWALDVSTVEFETVDLPGTTNILWAARAECRRLPLALTR